MERITVKVDEATKLTGWGRTRIYEKLAAGEIRAVKDGKSTLILVDSLASHIADLPPYEPIAKRSLPAAA